MINYSGQDSYTSSTVQYILLASDYITYNGGTVAETSPAQPHILTTSTSVDMTTTPVALCSHISGILLYLTASIVVDMIPGYVMILHPHIRYIANT